ncbi:TPA: calcium-binding protein, partial [Pasteurella multocida]|nr:calcium-binding protein [Pasteurella multocida]
RGGLGADTYIFSKGHGQDLIYEDSNETHRARDIDTIRFTDVSSQEVKFRRLGNDLMLFGYHETDSITIKSFYNHIDYQINRFEFTDKTISLEELAQQGMKLFGTEEADNIKDWHYNSIIEGQGGDDLIEGNGGDDTLIGGLGNDKLKGGFGADTYIFSKGHGQDLIYEDSNETYRARDIDTIRFTDVSSQEVKFRRLGNDLMLFG